MNAGNETDPLTFIWHVYFYHINRALDMPTKFKRWAIDITCPYLLNNLPSALTPDITDPHNAQENQNLWILMQKWNPISMQTTGCWLEEN